MSAATPSILADRDASPADQAEIRAMRVDLAAAYLALAHAMDPLAPELIVDLARR